MEDHLLETFLFFRFLACYCCKPNRETSGWFISVLPKQCY